MKKGYKLNKSIIHKKIDGLSSIMKCMKECKNENCKSFSFSKSMATCEISKEQLIYGFNSGYIESANENYTVFFMTECYTKCSDVRGCS